MKTHARVTVIGGGANGVSTLYHLAKAGWHDVVLCERAELTAGSTWHAAGLLPLYHFSYTAGQFHKYSVDLYKELAAETGQEISLHVTGNLRLAADKEWLDEYKKYCGIANTIGVPFEMVTPDDIKKLWPFCETGDLLGGIYHPQDGHIAPADVTYAMAKGARANGAEIYQHTPVTGITRQASGELTVTTPKGNITCEHVVLATGCYAREVGAKLGLDVPAIPMEHQYIVTDEHPALVERHERGDPELAVLRDAGGAYYLREERRGFILGPYEQAGKSCFADGVPASFEKDLFPGDLDRLMPHVEAAMARVPMFAEVGIKEIVNGPMQYTPDGAALVGPAWGLRNVWLNEGHTYGIVGAGGVGRALAAWIIDGEPPQDMWDYDPRRYGDWADGGYVRVKNEETYRHMYHQHYPNEERGDARPHRVSALYGRLDKSGAVWGHRYGMEVANWFALTGEAVATAPTDTATVTTTETTTETTTGGRDESIGNETTTTGGRVLDVPSFRRSNDFGFVRGEALGLHQGAGLMDISAFTNFEVTGANAEGWLDSLVANKVPSRVGGIALCHSLYSDGGIRSEFTVTKLDEGRFYVVSSTTAERFDWDFFNKSVVAGVELRNRYLEMGTLVLAGPRARDILAETTDTSLATSDFPWLTAREMRVAGRDVYGLRINFAGDLGWELHGRNEDMPAIFDALVESGGGRGLVQVGMRALGSLRLEKSYRLWSVDLTADYSVLESGLGRFVRLNKDADFCGRAALLHEREHGVRWGEADGMGRGGDRCREFVTMEVEHGGGVESAVVDGVRIADPYGNEPLFSGGRMVGRVTSGGCGHRVGKVLVLAYVEGGFGGVGAELEIEILGERYVARVIPESPFDPSNTRLRA